MRTADAATGTVDVTVLPSSVDATSRIYALHPDQPLVTGIRRGQPFTFATLDASGNQITEQLGLSAVQKGRLFPVNGPFEIEGVTPGTAVGITIHSVVPAAIGHTWTRKELGIAAPVDFHVRELDSMHPVIDWGDGPRITVPSKVHIGTIGLLPDNPTEPRRLGRYGGNMDFAVIAEGATVWLTAQVQGGGLFVGDVHASIGDAEVCGSGIEVAADITLSVETCSEWAPVLPTVVSNGRAWIIVDGDTFEEALHLGVETCTRLLSDAWGMSVPDAYLAVGLLLETRICQVVNSRLSLALSLAGGADSAFLPEDLLK
ncbi:acetamidase/formamidase family protein [Homoserinimonas sp. OAct 916]|uniref:acetamidase/formamidase family protein n=1 Tax=Homoserinimonas sp. OAct 916 TaxID=2211450 RepID=UPI000DBE9A40|nr:acetamidase/formamidase family protein [Homoserinimonas sp. OAct 916]